LKFSSRPADAKMSFSEFSPAAGVRGKLTPGGKETGDLHGNPNMRDGEAAEKKSFPADDFYS
jgi:hypothetical protein